MTAAPWLPFSSVPGMAVPGMARPGSDGTPAAGAAVIFTCGTPCFQWAGRNPLPVLAGRLP